MANLTLKIVKKETTEQEVEIPVPCFWRNFGETVYLGLLDEKTVVEVIDDQYERSVRNFDNSQWDVGMDRVREAHAKYHSSTETEFLEKFDAVIESISLHPKLAV